MFRRICLALAAIAALTVPAFAQDYGFFYGTDCSTLTPVAYQTWCGKNDGSWLVWNGSNWVPQLGPTIPSYTLATLPPAGTAGRLARVTDNIRGVWMDDGAQWVSVTGVANVKDFGANGNDITDDTAAIQAAIAAVNSIGGGTVYFPAGTYRHTGLTLPRFVNLLGIGSNRNAAGTSGAVSVLKNMSSVGSANITVDFSAGTLLGTSIRGLALVGGGTNTGDGLRIWGNPGVLGGATELTLDDLMIFGNGGDGLSIKYSWVIRVQNSFISANSGYGVNLFADANAITFVGVHIQGNFKSGVYARNTLGGLAFLGCTIEGNSNGTTTYFEVELQNVHGVSFNGCYFERNPSGAATFVDIGPASRGVSFDGSQFSMGLNQTAIHAKGGNTYEVTLSVKNTAFRTDTGGTAIYLEDFVEAEIGPNYYSPSLTAKIQDGGTLQTVFTDANSTIGEWAFGRNIPSIRGQALTSFVVGIFNDAGTLKHKIVAGSANAVAGSYQSKIVGASTTYVATPSVGAGVDFTNGVGIVAASPYILSFNTAAQIGANLVAWAFVESYGGGVSVPLLATEFTSRNVNGTTQVRLELEFSTPLTAAPWNINTTNIPAGTAIYVRVVAFLR